MAGKSKTMKHFFNENVLFESVTKDLISEEMYRRIMENVVMTKENEMNRIALQMYQNINQSMLEDGRQTKNVNFQKLTDLLRKHKVLTRENTLTISEWNINSNHGSMSCLIQLQ